MANTGKHHHNKISAMKEFDHQIKDSTKGLHQLLDEFQLVHLNDEFNKAEGRKMNRPQLKEILAKVAKIEYPDNVFEQEFLKINTACNGYVTWHEFISYLILGFQQAEVSTEFETLDAPIPAPPTMFKSYHRHPINRITFYPTVKPDRTCTWHDGSIITSSNDGMINYWTLDMNWERSVQSTCPELKVQTTWVTDLVVLPDVSVICTSSSERDLRFYDTSARKFVLRVNITSLDYAVSTMHYKFYQDADVESKLILGDMNGGVKILLIKTFGRGPFKSLTGIPLLSVRWKQVVKGNVDNFRVILLPTLHTNYVRQVDYYPTLHSVVSCTQCSNTALLLSNIIDITKSSKYKVHSGVWCFALEVTAHMIATGGPDCIVRIWNPFVPHRPTSTFYGHHTGIVQLLFQDQGKKLYSLSKDKCIKVWDIALQTCLQTYLYLPNSLGERSELTTLYNPESRQWIIGSTMIAVIPLSPKQSGEHTDGNTHSSGVSVVLYNKLFKVLVTCGLDSYIVVWDPSDGRRLLVIKEAHTRMFYGEIISVEITAATFDPCYQRLLTGANDGSLKIWNFNTGTCLRNMSIDTLCEVQSVIWVKNRILAMGWNKRVTEFADSETIGSEGIFSKNWDLWHSDDISSGVVKIPETLATSSYVGELVLWRLETGQPYKKFIVSNPTERIKLAYTAQKDKSKTMEDSLAKRKRFGMAETVRATVASITSRQSKKRASLLPQSEKSLAGPKFLSDRVGKLSVIKMPEESFNLRRLAVHCMLFLTARKSDPQIGTLLVSLENGVIQVWNHTVAGSFITSFMAVHKPGDYAISLATDEKNEFLFVGTTAGYVKTWLLLNYCILPEDEVDICLPKYRLMFPFMWGDRFVGRARRMITNQTLPILLNSYKGHLMPITGLTYIEESKIVISSSADLSVRMWTLGGRYIQTIGTFKPYKVININENCLPEDFEYTIPPDIQGVASSTTLRVLSGGSFAKRLTIKQLQKQTEKDFIHIDRNKIHGSRLPDPILGNFYDRPERTVKPNDIKFDLSFNYIPVYQHLTIAETKPIIVPDPPKGSNTNFNVKNSGNG